eukprot:ANDGO_07294.mRNA.1 Sodium/potassium-transporting ATPase subunit alpha
MASASASARVPVAFEEMRQSLDLEGRSVLLSRMQWKFDTCSECSPAGPDSVVTQSSAESDSVSTAASSRKIEKLLRAPQPKDILEHKLSNAELGRIFQSNLSSSNGAKSGGLSDHAVQHRAAQFGPNALTPPKRPPLLLQYLRHCTDLFSVMLLSAGVLSFVLLALDPTAPINVWLGLVLIVVVVINAFISFAQERKSSRIMEQFQNMLPQACSGLRTPKGEHRVSAVELVPGDVVHLKEGERVPADIRILEKMLAFRVDNASLTGEAEPQERNAASAQSENPLEASNLVFYGTFVASGEAYGIVIRTGDATVIGQLATITSQEAKQASTLSVEIGRFVKRMGVVATCSAVGVFVYAVAYGFPILMSFIIAIGMVVAWVPQGLPATVTMLLAIAAKKMAEKKVLVKDLQAVETLGSITCLASDKTGTLTQNKMTVTNLWLNKKHYFVSSAIAGPMKSALFDEVEPAMVHLDEEGHGEACEPSRIRRFPGMDSVENADLLLRSCLICCRAHFDPVASELERSTPLQQRKILGDATETGLFRFAVEFHGIYTGPLRKIFEIPFHSDRKWNLGIYRSVVQESSAIKSAENPAADDVANDPPVLLIKGAPERIWEMCSHYVVGSDRVPIGKECEQMFMNAYEQIAARGLRVLGFAMRVLDDSEDFRHPDFAFRAEPPNFPLTGMTFVGLVGLMDPPKPGVRKAIAEATGAGVKVMMVTGDHPITAQAIADDVGILRHPVVALPDLRQLPLSEGLYDRGIVLHGSVLPQLSDRDWFQVLQCRDVVFARTSPKQKLEIVLRCQLHGHVVGVTGDGVNDSPALKRADLGISMGISGSDVSKEAAAMVLMDDEFSSVLVGIRAGRLIFENLKKSIAYTLTHIIVEVIPIFLNLFLGFPIPMLPLCILLVDLGTELFPAATFAYLDEECDLLKLPPRVSVLPCGSSSGAWKGPSSPGDGKFSHAAAPVEHRTTTSRIPSVDMESLVRRDARLPAGDVVAAKPVTVAQVRNEHAIRERLIDWKLIVYAYMYMGILETCGATLAYFLIFYVDAGLTPSDLYQSGGTYFLSTTTDDFVTAHKRLSPSEQMQVLGKAQSAYFIGLVLLQIIHLFLSKTRRTLTSLPMIFQRRNAYSILYSLSICIIIVYVPGFDFIIGTGPANGLSWLYALPFGLLMVLLDSARKVCMKKGWLLRWLFY